MGGDNECICATAYNYLLSINYNNNNMTTDIANTNEYI